MGIPDHLTCLLRNLYAGQEATVRPDMEQWTGSKLGKDFVKAIVRILSPCLFNFWMNPKLIGIKISRRNINNFRYLDDTTLMAESER